MKSWQLSSLDDIQVVFGLLVWTPSHWPSAHSRESGAPMQFSELFRFLASVPVITQKWIFLSLRELCFGNVRRTGPTPLQHCNWWMQRDTISCDPLHLSFVSHTIVVIVNMFARIQSHFDSYWYVLIRRQMGVSTCIIFTFKTCHQCQRPIIIKHQYRLTIALYFSKRN